MNTGRIPPHTVPVLTEVVYPPAENLPLRDIPTLHEVVEPALHAAPMTATPAAFDQPIPQHSVQPNQASPEPDLVWGTSSFKPPVLDPATRLNAPQPLQSDVQSVAPAANGPEPQNIPEFPRVPVPEVVQLDAGADDFQVEEFKVEEFRVEGFGPEPMAQDFPSQEPPASWSQPQPVLPAKEPSLSWDEPPMQATLPPLPSPVIEPEPQQTEARPTAQESLAQPPQGEAPPSAGVRMPTFASLGAALNAAQPGVRRYVQRPGIGLWPRPSVTGDAAQPPAASPTSPVGLPPQSLSQSVAQAQAEEPLLPPAPQEMAPPAAPQYEASSPPSASLSPMQPFSAPAKSEAAPGLSVQEAEDIIQIVLQSLQKQIDQLLEYRVKEILSPALSRVAEALVHEIREDLAHTLTDVVSRAVNQEIAKRRSKIAG